MNRWRRGIVMLFSLILVLGETVLAAEVYTEAEPPERPAINAIVDNPEIGDETVESVWVENSQGEKVTTVVGDEIYTAHIYVRVSGEGVAEEVRAGILDFQEGSVAGEASSAGILVYVRSKNAIGFSIRVPLFAEEGLQFVSLYYIPGSAKLYTDVLDGVELDDAEFCDWENGTLIGYDQLDGKIPSGTEYALEITYQFRTEARLAEVLAKHDEAQANYEVAVAEVAEMAATEAEKIQVNETEAKEIDLVEEVIAQAFASTTPEQQAENAALLQASSERWQRMQPILKNAGITLAGVIGIAILLAMMRKGFGYLAANWESWLTEYQVRSLKRMRRKVQRKAEAAKYRLDAQKALRAATERSRMEKQGRIQHLEQTKEREFKMVTL